MIQPKSALRLYRSPEQPWAAKAVAPTTSATLGSMDGRGFIAITRVLLLQLHELSLGYAAMYTLLKRKEQINAEEFDQLKAALVHTPTAQKRLAAISKLESMDLETVLRDFEGPIQ